MLNRIQEILDRYELTAAKFADQLGVPRSTISHILSERNKPSLEFIQKVLDNYPEISTKWLVKGEGEIFEGENNLFYQPERKDKGISQAVLTESSEKPAENSINPHIDQEIKNDQNLRREKKQEMNPFPADIQKDKTLKPPKLNQGKKIVKLITLYDDNTFDEFYPSGDTNN